MGLGMWIFMLVCNLLIPLIMIGFGLAFVKKPPKDVNGAYGYRTSMSMKNQDTWNFAHQVCGRIWWKTGLALLVFTVAGMLRHLWMEPVASTLYQVVQVVVMIATIIPVERALSKNFDKNGNRR